MRARQAVRPSGHPRHRAAGPDDHPLKRTPVMARRRYHLWLLVLALAALLAGAIAAGAAWVVLQRSGRTPVEVLDYADRRMLGHPKVEWLAAPFMKLLRTAFDARPLKQRLATAFEVPPPPPRRGAVEISPPTPVPEGATVWRVGPGGPFSRIADVARKAKDGDIVEIEAGDYHGDVATWRQKRLTIRGVNGAARLFAAGRLAEGKAIWVFSQGDFDVSNIDFVGARAGDRNGAGIRLERGRLRLRACLFWDNQMGLVTAGLPYATQTSLEIEASEFAYSHVDRKWGHNLYVGSIDRLRVTGSYFHHASRGHLLKSRAAFNELLYNRLSDEGGGRASYEVNFPNGGQVLMVGNIVQQQQDTENGIMVSYGEEGYRWHHNELVMASNTLVNDHLQSGAFLRVKPGALRVVATNNLLVGRGRYLVDDPLRVGNDRRAEWPDLARPSRHDYRLRDVPAGRFAISTDGDAAGAAVPDAQYLHPRRVQALSGPPRVVGAEQRSAD